MKARPILFSAPMVQALLDGRKTMTRRIVKPSVVEAIDWCGGGVDDEPATVDTFQLHWCVSRNDGKPVKEQWLISSSEYQEEGVVPIGVAYGNVGDLLWVRETWKPDVDDMTSGTTFRADNSFITIENSEEAANKWIAARKPEEQHPQMKSPVWRPSIFMPRWASRLILEIIDIRIERLNDISEEDAISEGVIAVDVNDTTVYTGDFVSEMVWPEDYHENPESAFSDLWQSINGPDSWDKNPWVWVVEFKVHKMNVDAYIQQKK